MKRHTFNKELLQRLFDSNIEYIPKKIERAIMKQNFRHIGTLSEVFRKNFYYSFALDNLSESEQIIYANKALYSYTAYLQGVMNPNTTLELEFAPNEYLTLPITKGNYDASMDIKCFKNILLGIILRNDKKVASLQQFDMAMTRKNYSNNEYYSIVFYQQLFDWMMHWQGEKHGIYLEWFKKELATVSQQVGYESRSGWCYAEFAQGLIALETGNEAQLNEMIEKTVKHHHVIYQSPKGLNPGDPPMHDDADGFICLKALTLAAMGHDKGWNITYESDYLPKFLVEYKG